MVFRHGREKSYLTRVPCAVNSKTPETLLLQSNKLENGNIPDEGGFSYLAGAY